MNCTTRIPRKRSLILLLVCLFYLPASGAWELDLSSSDPQITSISSTSERYELSRYLDAHDIRYTVESTQRRESLGFIVVSEPFINKAAADPELARLASRGVKDYLYVGRGDYVDRISIGVFGSRASAQRRADSVNDRGFNFRVVERFRTLTSQDIVITSNVNIVDLRRILNGETISRQSANRESEQARAPQPAIPESAATIPSTTETDPEPDPATLSQREESQSLSIPETETATEAAVQEKADAERTTPEPLTTVTTTDSTHKDQQSNWLWPALILLLLIVAAAAVYNLMRRKSESVADKPRRRRRSRPATTGDDDNQQTTAAVAEMHPASTSAVVAEPVDDESAGAGTEEPEPVADPEIEPVSSEKVLEEYAESILAGRPGGTTISQQLTILGSDDDAMTDLIQDLLFLARLQADEESLDDFAFNSMGLVDSLISRLLAEAGNRITIKSVPAEIPTSLSTDPHKVSRVLTILLRYAISRTQSGQIAVSQSFEDGQLQHQIRFHPEGSDVEAELNTMVNPASQSSDLDINDRVRFGIANRLATVLGGRIDATLEQGEATVLFRCPAAEVEPPETVIRAELEERSQAEIAEARAEAEARISETSARIAEIEQNAARSIRVLQDELSGIEEESRQNSAELENRDLDITRLRNELEAAHEERDRKLAEADEERTEAIDKLSAANAELEKQSRELEEKLSERAASEASARQRVDDLEKTIETNRAEHEAALVASNERETAANSEVQSLRGEIQSLENEVTKSKETSTELMALKAELAAAEQKVELEQKQRAEAEQASSSQVTATLAQLNEARKDLESVSTDRESLKNQLAEAVKEIATVKSQLQQETSEAKAQVSNARSEIDRLNTELGQASESLAKEQAARKEAEASAGEKLASLENQLKTATEARDTARARQEERINEATASIDRLTQELGQAQSELDQKESSAEQQDKQLRGEIDELRSQLGEAQQKLDMEVSRRDTSEAATGSQISELMDELNQLKTENAAAEERAQQQEQDRVQQISEIFEQLETSEKALEAERQAKSDIEASSTQRISEMEAELNRLQQERDKASEKAQRAEEYGERQTSLLHEALADAESANRVGNAARKVTQHLKAKIKRLEDQVSELESQQVIQAPAEDEVVGSHSEKQSEAPQSDEAPVRDSVAENVADPAPEKEATAEPETETETETEQTEPETPELVLEVEPEDDAPDSDVAAATGDDEADFDFSLEDFSDNDEDHRVTLEDETVSHDEITPDESDKTSSKEPLSLALVPEEELTLSPPTDTEPADSEDEAATADSIQEPIEAPELSLVPQSETANSSEPEPDVLSETEAVAEPEPASESATSLEYESDLQLVPESELAGETGSGSGAGSGSGPEPESAPEPVAEPESEPEPEPEAEPEEFQFSDKPIRSSRPVNNPILHSMIERFVDRLHEVIESMENSLSSRDYLELMVSCNWVRGEANTLGFEILIGPVQSIEEQLRSKKFSQIITHLSVLRHMAERIEIKHVDSDEARIRYVVPTHATSTALYENFVSQLGTKLLELEVAASDKNTRQMSQLCRWVERYGEKIKFVEVVDAAKRLHGAVDDTDFKEIDQQLTDFVSLYGKIEIVKPEVAD